MLLASASMNLDWNMMDNSLDHDVSVLVAAADLVIDCGTIAEHSRLSVIHRLGGQQKDHR